MSLPAPVILLIEDSADDAFFMRYALQKSGINHDLRVVTTGQQAVDYLSGLGEFADRNAFPLPTFVFLDLKLPLLNGFEILSWMRNQPALRDLPVIVLTGSSEDRDKRRAMELGAKSYCVKPAPEEFLRRMLES